LLCLARIIFCIVTDILLRPSLLWPKVHR
jgi:hypothetical protein